MLQSWFLAVLAACALQNASADPQQNPVHFEPEGLNQYNELVPHVHHIQKRGAGKSAAAGDAGDWWVDWWKNYIPGSEDPSAVPHAAANDPRYPLQSIF